MDNNPYKPPATPLRETPPPPRSPILAVIVGFIVDIGGTLVGSIVLGIIYAATLASSGARPQDIETALSAIEPSSGYFIAGAAVGAACSFLGGYVCARLARRLEHRLCGIVAVLSALTGLGFGGNSDGTVISLVSIVLTVVSVMLGGELGRRRNVASATAGTRPT